MPLKDPNKRREYEKLRMRKIREREKLIKVEEIIESKPIVNPVIYEEMPVKQTNNVLTDEERIQKYMKVGYELGSAVYDIKQFLSSLRKNS